jgi:C4-dicarboxylate transporter, DctM subunit
MILHAVTVLVVLMALSIPVAATMGILGLSLSGLYSTLPLSLAAGEMAWATSTSFILVSIPLFILLGEILLRSGMAERMYGAMVQWLSWIPGGLMHSNIGACTMFAATSGSSVATAATIGTVALEEVKKHGYNERLFLGSLAAGGTLGILIPPSINMIVYGVLTSTSIPQLYLAGFIPGFILAGLFMVTILVACLWRREWGGRRIPTSWATRIRALPDLLPPLFIFLLVVGSIYLGVVGALVLAAANGRLTAKTLLAAVEGTMKTSAMVMAILVAAYFLNFVITSIGLTDQVNRFITSMGLTPFGTLMVVIGFYVILGMFMETLSMMVATVPIITPVIVGLGYDPVWFGIIVILLVETAMITPPVGINLFVVQGIRHGGHINDVLIGAAPFVVTLLVMVGLLVAFPGIALWMPETFGR